MLTGVYLREKVALKEEEQGSGGFISEFSRYEADSPQIKCALVVTIFSRHELDIYSMLLAPWFNKIE